MNNDFKRKVLGAILQEPNQTSTFYADRLGMNATDFVTYSQELLNSGFLLFEQPPLEDANPSERINVTERGRDFFNDR